MGLFVTFFCVERCANAGMFFFLFFSFFFHKFLFGALPFVACCMNGVFLYVMVVARLCACVWLGLI